MKFRNLQIFDALFSIYTTMTYEACDVAPCDPQCSGGCNLPNDATQCLACKHDQLYFSKARFAWDSNDSKF